MDLSGYSEGAQALLGPGGAFEMAEADLGGVILPVFTNAPGTCWNSTREDSPMAMKLSMFMKMNVIPSMRLEMR